MKELLCAVHHIGLPTRDIEGTVEFYEKLGAEVIFKKTVLEEGKSVRVVHFQMANLIIEVYERSETPGISGAFDHLAFEVSNIEYVFKRVREEKLDLLAPQISGSDYWPEGMHWLMVIGPNGEKVEFAAK